VISAAAAAASIAVAEVGRIGAPAETAADATKESRVKVTAGGRPVSGGRGGYSHFGDGSGTRAAEE
jgi:hypothetical protein